VSEADIGALNWLIEQRNPALDAASSVLSDLASTTVVLVSGLVVAIAASLLLRHWWPFALMALALLGELALFLNSAIIVGRSRPDVDHLDAALPPTSSFPSGHTAAAICLYGGLAAIVLLVSRGWWRWLVVALAVLAVVAVAFGRLYRGAHHPSDVLGAVLLAVPIRWELQLVLFGFLSVLATLLWWRFGRSKRDESTQPMLNQRGARYVGRVFTLAEAIEEGSGKVELGDTVWLVQGADAPAGTRVRVVGVKGAELQVEKA
jgi:membrane protein implicated in regulation of membrane protease activity